MKLIKKPKKRTIIILSVILFIIIAFGIFINIPHDLIYDVEYMFLGKFEIYEDDIFKHMMIFVGKAPYMHFNNGELIQFLREFDNTDYFYAITKKQIKSVNFTHGKRIKIYVDNFIDFVSKIGLSSDCIPGDDFYYRYPVNIILDKDEEPVQYYYVYKICNNYRRTVKW